jgi:hypothetical protein
MSPERARIQNIRYATHLGQWVGEAYFDDLDQLHLLDANEEPTITGQRFDVLCTIDGGSAGSLTTTCDWTYTVTTMDGEPLGTTLSPTRRRLINTPYTITPDDTIGEGTYDINGDFVLRDANETIKTHACEESDG